MGAWRCTAKVASTSAVLVCLAATSAPAVAAQQSNLPPPETGLTIRLVDPPADPNEPRSGVYVIGHFAPGDVIERTVELANGEDEDVEVDFYVADATAADEWIVQSGRGVGDVAQWASLNVDTVVIPAGTRRTTDVTITIPDIAFGGERYAAIVAEPRIGSSQGVSVITRLGIRAYLSVGGPVEPATDFTIETMQPLRTLEGAPAVRIGVTNTGERVIDVTGQLQLQEGPGALQAGPFDVVIPTTLGPGFSGTVVVELDASLPAGPWRAVATLRSGAHVRQAEAAITFPELGSTAPGDTIGSNGEVIGPEVDAEPFIDRATLIPANLILLTLALVGVVATAATAEMRKRSAA